MKFLLVGINSKYIHSNPAIYSLSIYVNQKYPNTVTIREFTINNSCDSILEDIYEERPDALGLSCYIWNISYVNRIISELHKILPDCDIWLGGPEVSYNPGQLLDKAPSVKGIMVGEGEEIFLKLLDAYHSDNPEFGAIGGLMMRDSDYIAPERVDFDSIPFYYNDELMSTTFANRIVYYESQRGCPFRCSYCLSSIDKTMSFRSIAKVKDELSFFLRHNLPQVKFIDRTFNCDHARTLAILNYIKDNDNGITNFHFEIAADILNKEELALLSSLRPGQVQLEIGVQTTNSDTLSAIHRQCDMNVLRDNVASLLSNHNLHIHLDLIAGLPYEDMNSFINSFNEVYNMHPHQLQLGFLKVLKGTDMEKNSSKYGILYHNEPPYEVLATNWISYDDIIRLKKIEEMVELYYNSAQFTTTIPYLLSYFDTPFAFYDALAKYYQEHNYFVMTPKRFKKYEILLEFGQSHNIDEDILRDKLTFDYYLRENPKSKPDFVKNIPDAVFDYVHRDPITYNATLL